MFDAPAGAQMSFFPSEAEQIQSIAEAESVTPSAFSMFISQDDIDHILRTGGNADAARMKIAAEFSKQKPLEDRAAFLKALYYGGNGLITDNGRLSAWYGDDGIHIATGDTSRYLRSAQVIGWEDAAERIEELLDGGAFATNLEVTEAPRYERLGIAVDVWNLYHDFSDEAKSLGYLSCLGNIHSTSFPEETERLTDDLLNPAFRERLLSEYKVFMDAYRENRALLRFHYHKSQTLLTRLEDLSLPRKEFRSDMAAIPATGRFITEDEIAVSLANGSSFEGGKTRIYAFFQTSHTPKENADFLKKEYGIGGHTHAVSREGGSYEDHGSKGITLKKAGCADVQMNWNKVASRISELIHLGKNNDGFAINQYFIDNPEMVLGRQTSESTQYGRQDFTVVPIEGLALADQLHDAVKNIRGTYQEAELPELGEGGQIDTSIPADPNVKNYSYTVVGGEVYYRENSRMVKPELNATAAERVKGMVALRDCVNELIALQMDEYSAEIRIQEAQAELNRLYDAFSAKHGLINDRANRLAFSDDSSYYLLCSLEVLDDDGKLERKADMRNVAGLSTTDAQKSSDMFSKCRYMDELTGGRGVVFATGTPVSNSMTELYTIQRYLQHDRLQEMGMGHFDCWASRFGETTTALELAPEGTGYRARTRFAKFFNLPELMNLFKEVADIKTADQLHLPTPEVAYHTIATNPTEIQQDMVKALSERASKVHSGAVSPDVDNMLKITSDGRKLGLDQRIINPMLPDEETTKVNQCVANILQYWRNGEEEKLTQLVFCDISTPKTTPSQRAAKASPGTLDSPEIRALESAIPLEESSDTPFTVYEDVRQKLIAAGMPPEQIAFIHDANTEVKKRELFAKVRSGQVRVLMGSTAKMGAGTNVQDRLVALHDLDCPWRPRDLTQRKGRIERQGNQNKLVHVCRYVTEGTFDAYLWQTVENKQKFISQIMTSKSPVRSCEDVDATALSFAEIKALCAGDPRIKERMDLDIEVSKLKIMKADHNSKQFRLEDSLLKYFPEKIEEHKGFVRGLEADMQTLAAHPLPAEGFVGMEIRGDRLTDKENAGAALLDTCKEVKGKDPVQIGSYRGFTMSVAFDSMWKTYTLTLKGQMTHRVELGSDARGNLVRIENALDKMPERLRSVQEQLENLYNQQAAAKAEVGKPFPQEQELAAKTARLIELDMELNLDGKGQPQPEQAIAKSARPSVLDRLKAPPVHSAPEKPHKKEMEAR